MAEQEQPVRKFLTYDEILESRTSSGKPAPRQPTPRETFAETLDARRTENVGVIGGPSFPRMGELGKEYLIRGAANVLNAPADVASLAAQALGFLVPVKPAKDLAEFSVQTAEGFKRQLEEGIRGGPSPMIAEREGELPKVLPPADPFEKIFSRAVEFVPDVVTGRILTRGIKAALTPTGKGIKGTAISALKEAGSVAGASTAIASGGYYAEGVGGDIGERLGSRQAGEIVARILGETAMGVYVQPRVSAVAGRVVAPVADKILRTAGNLFTAGSLQRLAGQGADKAKGLTDALDRFYASDTGQKVVQYAGGPNAMPREVVLEAERALADLGLDVKVDLATRYGTDQLANMRKNLELRSESMRQRGTDVRRQMDEASEAIINDFATLETEANLGQLSEGMLFNRQQLLANEISAAEQRLKDKFAESSQMARTDYAFGADARDLVLANREFTRRYFGPVYQELDNFGNKITAALPGGGYDISPLIRYIEARRGTQPRLFEQLHPALTYYDQKANKYLLKENPASTADNMGDSSEFPELVEASDMTDAESYQALRDMERVDADTYRGRQPLPAGDIPADEGAFVPVSFQTYRHWMRDISRRMRLTRDPILLRDLSDLRSMMMEQIRQETPELADAYQKVQSQYRDEFAHVFGAGQIKNMLAGNAPFFTQRNNQVLDALWNAGHDGAVAARRAGIGPGTLRVIAHRRLAEHLSGTGETSAENIRKWSDLNYGFLQGAGLYDEFMRNTVEVVESMNSSLKDLRTLRKSVEDQILERFIKSADPGLANQDIRAEVVKVVSNRQTREALVNMMKAPGAEAFRNAVIHSLAKSYQTQPDPFDRLLRVQAELRPVFDAAGPLGFDRALAAAAIVQTRKQMGDVAQETASSNRVLDVMQERFGTSAMGMTSRMMNAVKGYMSYFYAAGDVLTRWGIVNSRKTADRMLEDMMFDPDGLQKAANMIQSLGKPNMSLDGAKRIVNDYNRYAMENGLAILVFETGAGSREEIPEVK